MQFLFGAILLAAVAPVLLAVEVVGRLTPDPLVKLWAEATLEVREGPTFSDGDDGSVWVQTVVVVHAPYCWGDGTIGAQFNGENVTAQATPLLPYRKGRRIGMSDVRFDELPGVCPVKIKARVKSHGGLLHVTYDGYKIGAGILLPART